MTNHIISTYKFPEYSASIKVFSSTGDRSYSKEKIIKEMETWCTTNCDHTYGVINNAVSMKFLRPIPEDNIAPDGQVFPPSEVLVDTQFYFLFTNKGDFTKFLLKWANETATPTNKIKEIDVLP